MYNKYLAIIAIMAIGTISLGFVASVAAGQGLNQNASKDNLWILANGTAVVMDDAFMNSTNTQLNNALEKCTFVSMLPFSIEGIKSCQSSMLDFNNKVCKDPHYGSGIDICRTGALDRYLINYGPQIPGVNFDN